MEMRLADVDSKTFWTRVNCMRVDDRARTAIARANEWARKIGLKASGL